jgi:hypothetical protein
MRDVSMNAVILRQIRFAEHVNHCDGREERDREERLAVRATNIVWEWARMKSTKARSGPGIWRRLG